MRCERTYLDQVFTESRQNGIKILFLAALAISCIVAAAIFLSVSFVIAMLQAFPALSALGTLVGAAAGCLVIALLLFLRIRVAADELKGVAGELTSHFFEEEDSRWIPQNMQ